MADETPGWLPCDNQERHEPHTWTYTDPNTGLSTPAFCDGGHYELWDE